MQLKGKVIVITRGLSEMGQALAEGLLKHGAIVIISDIDEKNLIEKASKTGMIAIAANINIKSDIKRLIDTITQRFKKIDLFVSNSIFSELGNHYLSEKDRDLSYQSDVMFQMYAAKYVFTQMIDQENV